MHVKLKLKPVKKAFTLHSNTHQEVPQESCIENESSLDLENSNGLTFLQVCV